MANNSFCTSSILWAMSNFLFMSSSESVSLSLILRALSFSWAANACFFPTWEEREGEGCKNFVYKHYTSHIRGERE